MYNLHIFNAHLHTTAYYIPRIYLNSTSTINNFNNIIETKDPMPDSLFILVITSKRCWKSSSSISLLASHSRKLIHKQMVNLLHLQHSFPVSNGTKIHRQSDFGERKKLLCEKAFASNKNSSWYKFARSELRDKNF